MKEARMIDAAFYLSKYSNYFLILACGFFLGYSSYGNIIAFEAAIGLLVFSLIVSTVAELSFHYLKKRENHPLD